MVERTIHPQLVNPIRRYVLHPHGHFRDRTGVSRFFFDRSHRHICNPAGNDLIERREIAANVERKSMHRDPMPDSYADGRDFGVRHPNAGQSLARSGEDVVGSKRLDKERLEPA